MIKGKGKKAKAEKNMVVLLALLVAFGGDWVGRKDDQWGWMAKIGSDHNSLSGRTLSNIRTYMHELQPYFTTAAICVTPIMKRENWEQAEISFYRVSENEEGNASDFSRNLVLRYLLPFLPTIYLVCSLASPYCLHRLLLLLQPQFGALSLSLTHTHTVLTDWRKKPIFSSVN